MLFLALIRLIDLGWRRCLASRLCGRLREGKRRYQRACEKKGFQRLHIDLQSGGNNPVHTPAVSLHSKRRPRVSRGRKGQSDLSEETLQ
jgi:hypothetical protein